MSLYLVVCMVVRATTTLFPAQLHYHSGWRALRQRFQRVYGTPASQASFVPPPTYTASDRWYNVGGNGRKWLNGGGARFEPHPFLGNRGILKFTVLIYILCNILTWIIIFEIDITCLVFRIISPDLALQKVADFKSQDQDPYLIIELNSNWKKSVIKSKFFIL
jgi:hypothetical protein